MGSYCANSRSTSNQPHRIDTKCSMGESGQTTIVIDVKNKFFFAGFLRFVVLFLL
jgi:hypothetical protein